MTVSKGAVVHLGPKGQQDGVPPSCPDLSIVSLACAVKRAGMGSIFTNFDGIR
jgi:hypothetical protein